MGVARTCFGRKADLSVGRWVAANAAEIAKLPYVLISSIDSDRDVESMPWVATRLLGGTGWLLSTSPVVLSGRSLLGILADEELFTGFDELWIPTRLPVRRPPDDAYLVAPRRFDGETPKEISDWLEASECRLGVGDGDGLNYVHRDPQLAVKLDLVGLD